MKSNPVLSLTLRCLSAAKDKLFLVKTGVHGARQSWSGVHKSGVTTEDKAPV